MNKILKVRSWDENMIKLQWSSINESPLRFFYNLSTTVATFFKFSIVLEKNKFKWVFNFTVKIFIILPFPRERIEEKEEYTKRIRKY